MTIRLNGQTSGYVELEAPAAAGSNTLVLPTGNGTSGQYLQTNGSGTLSWQTLTDNGLFESVAVVCDQKGAADGGGTFTSGAHRQRDLNTEIFDPDGIVSVSSNEFTLAAGNYLIIWRCPAFRVNTHVSRLRDMTANPNVSYEGTSAFSDSNSGQTESWGFVRVTPTASHTYQVRHRCESTKSGNGFGISSNSYASNSIHTIVWILKEV